uniref:Protein GUCD1 n=1 Tax=Clastoptera arizonana TaxID=38151 RepID=A0A1B6C5R9_9HEMI
MTCFKTYEQKADVLINLLHHQQRWNWDCGLSCVMMILPPLKRQIFLESFQTICQESKFNKSIWTIDLCYLLKRFDVRHIYTTVNFGVREEFKELSFYKEALMKDKARISHLFEEAENNGITIHKASLNSEELIQHLKNHGPIIVLVDANFLSCDNCISFNICSCFSILNQYKGHYIVICGYLVSKHKFFYRDPFCIDKICTTSFNQLTIARNSNGTDQDIILVFI